jgi:hypothetical protein
MNIFACAHIVNSPGDMRPETAATRQPDDLGAEHGFKPAGQGVV